MSHFKPVATLDTHSVENQAKPIGNYNLYDIDIPLQEALVREGVTWAEPQIKALGGTLGTEEIQRAGHDANRFPPELHQFDLYGHRIDEVQYHPAYHTMMKIAKEHSIHSIAWKTRQPRGHVVHSILEFLLGQVESGVCCPITMTYAAVPALKHHQALYDSLFPKLVNADYDSRFLPISEKRSITMGMAMTEKQGGSDVRANTTRAQPIGGDEYLLTGHKWFCSAPMSDAFLTLAQSKNGLSCFWVPRWTPNGERNRFFIQRLKNKLGNRSNASSEIEYNQTWCRLVGQEGRGIPTIIEMVHHTRLDCAHAAVSIQRQALTQAIHHCRHRKAFGKKLIDQPLMQNVLADLIVEYEANLMLALRVARAYDDGTDSPEQALFARVAVAITKYWTNKRCSYFVNEAMECLGGAGYIEDTPLPRLYREAPLNGIWEGSGNVICLDVLRAINKNSASIDIIFNEMQDVVGENRLLDNYILEVKRNFSDRTQMPFRARHLVEQMALALQGALLVKHGNSAVCEAFLRTRLNKEWGFGFGSLPSGLRISEILSRGMAW